MFKITTGITVYENFVSVDTDNNPVVPATFDVAMYLDGDLYTGITITTSLEDASRGIYSAVWSADTYGTYQFRIKNNNTRVIYMSDIYKAISDEQASNVIYIGL